MPTPKSYRAAGAALIAGPGVYLAAEFTTAAAWTDPPYSYTHHFISALGVRGPATAFGQFMLSPLAPVMNAGLVLFGLVVLAGVLALPLPRTRHLPVVVTAAVLAAGSAVVALFPGDGDALDSGAADHHALGAFAAFTAGNALVILLGAAHHPLGVPRRRGRALVALGVLGLAGIVGYVALLAAETGVLVGLVERTAIYPFLLGLLLLGRALRRNSRPGGETGLGAGNSLVRTGSTTTR
ncbi:MULTISPECIES: DUF998 domain-containing protein [Actinosynnema]|uniref:DUF998 domain-containing protein n=1 Tax=Actinosynnema TaxID=40566 RepID=UPI0020A60D13|nr:DUF998 domain-containing protein [Actinosynnema pretiosum]MCP2097662.1 Protein of unknown function (DUF998) [Actinosynnema pretiosum]